MEMMMPKSIRAIALVAGFVTMVANAQADEVATGNPDGSSNNARPADATHVQGSDSTARKVSSLIQSSITVQLENENVILDLPQRQALGFAFGPSDGSIGAIRKGDRYEFFVSAGNLAKEQGTFRLGGDLAHFNNHYGTNPSLTKGAAPDGYTFDRDYAGGGTLVPIEDGQGHHGILLVYHGEYHPGTYCNNVPWFYGGLGMALSTDGGKTFHSLGQIIQPTLSRPQWQTLPKCRNAGIGYGTLVLGDDRGNALDPARTPWNRGYYYVFFTDMDSTGATHSAVARARRSDVIAAALSGNSKAFPALFEKYDAGNFTPATSGDPDNANPSGSSSPLDPPTATQMSVIYDRDIRQCLMAYVLFPNASSATLYLQMSPNLLQWPGQPAATVPLDGASTLLGYPSLIGDTSSPNVAGWMPVLFYLSASQWFPNWGSPDTRYVSRQVQITRQLVLHCTTPTQCCALNGGAWLNGRCIYQ